MSTITYPYNPLDAVGWHGTLMPVRINWRDIRPLMSHLRTNGGLSRHVWT